MMSTKDVKKLQKEVESQLSALCKKFRADSATFHLYDAERDQFLFPVGISLKQPEQFGFLPSPTGPAARILNKGLPLFENNVEDNPEFRGPFTLREGVKSSAGLPLLGSAQRRIGIVFLNYTTPHAFSEEEKGSIADIVSRLALKIETWLTDDLWQNLRAQETFLEEQFKLRQIAVAVCNVLSNSEVAIWLLERKGEQETLVLNAYAGFEGFPASIVGETILLTDSDNFIARAVRANSNTEVATFPNDKFHQKGIQDRPWRAAWALPMGRSGALVVYRFVPGKLTENEIAIAKAFADQARVTIEAHKRIYDLEELSRVGKNLNLVVDPAKPNELLQKIVTTAAQLTKADRIVLLPYDQGHNDFLDVTKYAVTYPIETGILTQPRKNEGASDYVLRNGSMIIPDVDDAKQKGDQRVVSGSFEKLGIKAAYDIRLMADNEAVGVLMFNYFSPQQFTRNEAAVISLFADYAASAIRNERLVRGLKEGLENLTVLRDVGNALSSRVELTEDDIFDIIYLQAQKHIRLLVNMYVALYDEATDEIRFGLVVDEGRRRSKEDFLRGSQSGYAPRRGGQGRTEEIIRTKKKMFHKTREEAQGWYEREGRKEYLNKVSSCWMGVPMLVRDRVIGVLAAFHPSIDNAYSEADFQFLDALADQAAWALENSHSYNERRRLSDISSALASETDLEKVLSLVTAKAEELLKADLVAIYQYDHESEEFYLSVTSKLQVQPLPSKTGVVSKIVKAGQLIFAENVLEHPLLGASRFVQQQNIKSCAAMPLIYDENCIGVLFVNYFELHKFAEPYKAILSSVAGSAAVAINMAGRLYEANRQLATVLRSIETVRERDTLDELLDAYLRFALAAVGSESGTIQLLDPQTGNLVISAVSGNILQRKYQKISLEQGITGRAAREKQLIYVPDITADPDYVNYFDTTRCEMAVPFLVEGEPLGVLNAEHPQADAFDVNKRHLFELFASQASVLIRERMRLQDAYQREIKEKLNKRSSDMIRSTAHNLNNYLGGAKADISAVLQDAGLPLKQSDLLKRIKSNIERCFEMTEELFKPYRYEERVEQSLRLLIREAIDHVNTSPNITITLNIPDSLPKVWIEPKKAVDYFREILVNGKNAIQRRLEESIIQQGYIEITSSATENDWIELSFINNGPPIPEEDWEKIFEQFSHVSEKSSGHHGLGLWGARTFFEEQGGSIFVLESNEEQTTFQVRLPSKLALGENL